MVQEKHLGSFRQPQSADYDVFQHATPEEARQGLKEAQLIVETILEYARTNFGFSHEPSHDTQVTKK